MKKSIKWAIPFAVLALTCGIAAGCGGKHEHSYTEWGYNTTQHWKQCPEDDEIDESTKKDHNFVDGSCECGATQQTPPAVDVTITNGTTDTNGTVTLSKTTAKTGESVTVTVAPKEGYQIKDVTVNGEGVLGAMTGNSYTFTVTENTTVIAQFEKIATSSINAPISGKKLGVEGNTLKAGDTVTLTADGKDEITAELEAGTDGNVVLKVAELAGATWTVKADGYANQTINVPRDVEYNTAITLQYNLMENLNTSWGNTDTEDLSNQNGGEVGHVSGYTQWVSTKDSYDSVAITATAVKGGFRQGVFIRFAGDSYDKDKYVLVSKENQDKIGWCAMDGGTDYQGSPISGWEDNIKPLTKDEYELTLVRDGADIYFFIDGEYVNKKTFAEYANQKCYVGLFCTDATKMEKGRTFRIENAVDYINVDITDETAEDAHGTVTIDKPNAKLNETVTVTLTADTNYKIKDLKIDGVSVIADMTGNTYSFTAAKDTTVVAEFEEITVGSVNIQITGKKYGVEGNALKAGDTVTLSAAGLDDVTAQITASGDNLILSVSEITAAIWKVKVDEYQTATITVEKNAECTTPVTLEYDLMENLCTSWGWNDTTDLSDQNNGTLTHKNGYNQWVSSKNSYGTVAITATVLKGGQRQGVFIRFKGNSYDDDRYAMIQKEWEQKITWNGAGDIKGKNLCGDWTDYINPLTDEVKSKIEAGNFEITIVRVENKIYVFVDGIYHDLKILPAEYKDMECYVGIYCTNAEGNDGIVDRERKFKIEENVSSYLTDTVLHTVAVTDGTTDENGTVEFDKTAYKFSDDVTITVTPKEGYACTSLKVDGNEVTQSAFMQGKQFTFVALNDCTVVATFVKVEYWESATLTLNGVTEGTQVNLYNDLCTVATTVGADGVVTLTGDNKITKGVYAVTVGNVVFEADFTAESSLTKTIANTTSDNFTAKDTVKVIDMGAAKTVTEYSVTFNLKTTSTAAGWQQRWSLLLIDGNDSTTTGIGCIANNDNQLLVWAALGSSPDDKNPTKYGEAKYLKFDELVHGSNGVNIKVVRNGSKATMYFESENEWIEMLSVTLGSGETNLKFACNWGVEWSVSNIAIDYVKYAVNVSASVNDAALGSIACDKESYNNGDTCTITVTVNEGNELKSLTISGETITTGWTKGDNNTYTYSFIVSESTEIVAELEGKKVWESATLTLNGVAENTEVKLSDGVDTITATADANGVVILTGESQIGKKVYTVTVGNIVFDVDFTAESSVEKTIKTVTVADFTARDNYNEGAKVIDMGVAKNSTEYAVTFNLKTTSTAAGWQQRWSLLLINGDNDTTTGIGCIGKNDNQLLVWAAYGASADDKDPTKYSEEKYLKFDELVHTANGVNMKVVRHGSKATMYFELENEWIEMLSVTLGNGETNLKFACSYGVDWSVSNIEIEYISEYRYVVDASIEGDTHGYKVNVEQTANAATVTIVTQNWGATWKYFPTAIVVNGVETTLTTADYTSTAANHLTYTYTIDHLTADTTIKFKVTEVACIEGLVKVSVDGNVGGTAVSDSGENGYHWNDGCDVYITPAEGYEIESITITRGKGTPEVITEGWGAADGNGKITYTVSGGITEQTTIVVKFKTTVTTEPTTSDVGGETVSETDPVTPEA